MFGKKKQGFTDLPNTMVLTTRDVLEKKEEILYVSHDIDDGMWQFHSGKEVEMDDALLVALKEIVEYDSTVTSVADLPLGWIAWRDNVESPWRKEKSN